MSRPSRPPHVHKFGGASLASAPAIAHAVSIVQAQGRVPMVVVVSALAGVTDALLEIAARVARGERGALFPGCETRDTKNRERRAPGL